MLERQIGAREKNRENVMIRRKKDDSSILDLVLSFGRVFKMW